MFTWSILFVALGIVIASPKWLKILGLIVMVVCFSYAIWGPDEDPAIVTDTIKKIQEEPPTEFLPYVWHIVKFTAFLAVLITVVLLIIAGIRIIFKC